MNPELADRLRRFGATVDQTAIAAQDERSAAQGPIDGRVAGDDIDALPTVVPILAARSTRRYRSITAAAAAAIVVAAGAVITARVTGDDEPSPTASTEVVAETTTSLVTTTTAPPPTTIRPAVPPASSANPTSTTTSTTTTTTAPPPTAPLTCPNGYDPYPQAYPIRVCHQGPAVALIQTLTGAPADGLFGPATRQSVRVFQELHGLNADGLVGPLTWAAMFPDGAPGTDADGDGTVEPWEVS